MVIETPPIPNDMLELMKSLAKQVIKEKPDNIYEFSAKFFEGLLIERDGSLDKGYGKFRSYEKYCAFMDKMARRAPPVSIGSARSHHGSSDSGVGSGGLTSDGGRPTSSESNGAGGVGGNLIPPLEVNGVAMKAVPRQTTQHTQRKPANVSIHSSNRSLSVENSTNSDAKVAPSPNPTPKLIRKHSSKKPADNLIVIAEETSSDVADTEDVIRQTAAAIRIQRAFRRVLNQVREKKETKAAETIQKAYKSFAMRKIASGLFEVDGLKPIAPNIEEVHSEIDATITGEDKFSDDLLVDTEPIATIVEKGSEMPVYDASSIQGNADAITNFEMLSENKMHNLNDKVQIDYDLKKIGSTAQSYVLSHDQINHNSDASFTEHVQNPTQTESVQRDLDHLINITETIARVNSEVEVKQIFESEGAESNLNKEQIDEHDSSRTIASEDDKHTIVVEKREIIDPESVTLEVDIKANYEEPHLNKLERDEHQSVTSEVGIKVDGDNKHNLNPIESVTITNDINFKEDIATNSGDLDQHTDALTQSISPHEHKVDQQLLEQSTTVSTSKNEIKDEPDELHKDTAQSENTIIYKTDNLNQQEEIKMSDSFLELSDQSPREYGNGDEDTTDQGKSLDEISIDPLDPLSARSLKSEVDDANAFSDEKVGDVINIADSTTIESKKLIDEDLDNSSTSTFSNSSNNSLNNEIPAKVVSKTNPTLNANQHDDTTSLNSVSSITTSEFDSNENQKSHDDTNVNDLADIGTVKISEPLKKSKSVLRDLQSLGELTEVETGSDIIQKEEINQIDHNSMLNDKSSTITSPESVSRASSALTTDSQTESYDIITVIENIADTKLVAETETTESQTICINDIVDNTPKIHNIVEQKILDVADQLPLRSCPENSNEMRSEDEILDGRKSLDTCDKVPGNRESISNEPKQSENKGNSTYNQVKSVDDKYMSNLEKSVDDKEKVFEGEIVAEVPNLSEIISNVAQQDASMNDDNISHTENKIPDLEVETVKTLEFENNKDTQTKKNAIGKENKPEMHENANDTDEDNTIAIEIENVSENHPNADGILEENQNATEKENVPVNQAKTCDTPKSLANLEPNLTETNKPEIVETEEHFEMSLLKDNRHLLLDARNEPKANVSAKNSKTIQDQEDSHEITNSNVLLDDDVVLVLDEKNEAKENVSTEDGKTNQQLEDPHSNVKENILILLPKDAANSSPVIAGNNTNFLDTSLEDSESGESSTDEQKQLASALTQPQVPVIPYEPLLSSDLSESDDVQVVRFGESGVDETSRDEMDELSEVENFDLTSCGEDSLEAMYYRIRKTEILLDKSKKENSLADKPKNEAYEEHGVSEQPSTTEVSNDDEARSTEEQPAITTIEAPTAPINPVEFAIEQQQKLIQNLHHHGSMTYEDVVAPLEDGEEDDQYPDCLDIRRKMWASSVSETDSDYVDLSQHRLARDDFNISTALDHVTSSDSDSTIVSAATKIQAGARGFLTRRRIRRSSAETSAASAEKACSFGNAAIDKSLEDLIEQQEQLTMDEAVVKVQRFYRMYRSKNRAAEKQQRLINAHLCDDSQCVGVDVDDPIIDVKLEQKKFDRTMHPIDGKKNNNRETDGVEERRDSISVKESASIQQSASLTSYDVLEPSKIDSTDTDAQRSHSPTNHLSMASSAGETFSLDVTQRRLTLQRGDAVQRNSTLDESPSPKNAELSPKERSTNNQLSYRKSSSLLGLRQNSMPVQIDSDFIRIIPKHLRKRIKSAGASSEPSAKHTKAPLGRK